jgi:hypothetical protein
MYNLQNLPKHTADYSGTHVIGIVDECYRCVNCEIGSWNAWKSPCPV